MEVLRDKIKKFLQLDIGSGYGSGFGDGYGSGSGYGDGISIFNGKDVFEIDNVQTIITHIYNNLAKGFILNSDFTLEPCYIAKGHNKFAHRKNIKRSNAKFTRKNI